MPVMKSLILLLAVLVGGALVPALRLKNNTGLRLLLSFSGAYILALCLFELLPEVYRGIADPSVTGFIILGGFLLQLVLDYISGGIEHGHTHNTHTHDHHHNNDHGHEGHEHLHSDPVVNRFPYMMMTGLCIHAFVEGIPLMLGNAGEELFLGIIFHNIPISITLMTVFLSAGKSLKLSFAALFVFGLMTPAGALLADWFIPAEATQYGFYALALVIGIFFHISTTILFESDQNHRFNLIKFLTIILGAGTAFLVN